MLLPLYDKNPHRRWPLVTVLLIVANVACFFLSFRGGVLSYIDTIYQRGFIPQRLTQIDDPQPVPVEFELPEEIAALPGQEGEPGQKIRRQLSTDAPTVYGTMVSSMFLHGGLLHLIANMWMLWVFGDNVEDRLGRPVYLLFYMLGGIVAVLSHWASDATSTIPLIGASGAVAAVLGAYAVTFPKAKVKTLVFLGIPWIFTLPSAIVLGAWLLLNLAGGIQALGGLGGPAVGDQVAYWTHIGGFVAGVVMGPLLMLGAEPPEADWRGESRNVFEY